MYREFIRINKSALSDFFKFIDTNYPNADINTFEKAVNQDNNLRVLLSTLCMTKKLQKIYDLVETNDDAKNFVNDTFGSFGSKLYDSYRLYKSGEKIFKVSDDLALQLMNTELKEVPAKLLKTPFEAIEIECNDYLVFKAGESRETKIASIFVDSCSLDGVRKFRFTFYKYDTFLLRQEIFYGCDFDFDEEKDVQQQIYDALEKDAKKPQNTDLHNTDFFRTIRLAVNFTLNILLYISSPEIKIAYRRDGQEKLKKLKGKERQRFKKKLQERPEIGIIGGEIVLKREEKELYIKQLRDGKPLSYRLLVMGHWKRQWYGSFSEERKQKVIWIQPYWRGLKNTEVSNKIHVVE